MFACFLCCLLRFLAVCCVVLRWVVPFGRVFVLFWFVVFCRSVWCVVLFCLVSLVCCVFVLVLSSFALLGVAC